jgi:hypothetical protein
MLGAVMAVAGALASAPQALAHHHPRREEVKRREARREEHQEAAFRRRERDDDRADRGSLTKHPSRQFNREENVWKGEMHRDFEH